MIFSNKILLSQLSAFLLLGTSVPYAGESNNLAPEVSHQAVIMDSQDVGLHKTLEYNFSPEDRARLRKALSDFARNTDPEHIEIEKKRKAMKASLKQRFIQCDSDVDESLNRQEATECLPQVARHFSYVDVDENNIITFEELELAQAKWIERHKAADAKVEAERLKEMEAELKRKGKRKIKKQASSADKRPG